MFHIHDTGMVLDGFLLTISEIPKTKRKQLIYIAAIASAQVIVNRIKENFELVHMAGEK